MPTVVMFLCAALLYSGFFWLPGLKFGPELLSLNPKLKRKIIKNSCQAAWFLIISSTVYSKPKIFKGLKIKVDEYAENAV